MGSYQVAARGANFLGGLLDVDNGSDEDSPTPAAKETLASPMCHVNAAPAAALDSTEVSVHTTNDEEAADSHDSQRSRGADKIAASPGGCSDARDGDGAQARLEGATCSEKSHGSNYDHRTASSPTGQSPYITSGDGVSEEEEGGSIDTRYIVQNEAQGVKMESEGDCIVGPRTSREPAVLIHDPLCPENDKEAAMLTSLGLGYEDRARGKRAKLFESVARTLLVVYRRGYDPEDVKNVIRAMWGMDLAFDDPDTVELQLRSSGETSLLVEGSSDNWSFDGGDLGDHTTNRRAANGYEREGVDPEGPSEGNGAVPELASEGSGGQENTSGERELTAVARDINRIQVTDAPQTIEGMLEAIAKGANMAAALVAMAQWAAVHGSLYGLPSSSAPLRAWSTAPCYEAMAIADAEDRDLAVLFDCDALPVIFERLLMLTTSVAPSAPHTHHETEIREACESLKEFLRWALPNVMDDDCGSNAAAVHECFRELLASARRLRTCGEEFALSPQAARLLSETLAEEIRAHRRDALCLHKGAMAAIGFKGTVVAASAAAARQSCSNDDGVGLLLDVRRFPTAKLLMLRENSRESAGALGELCSLLAARQHQIPSYLDDVGGDLRARARGTSHQPPRGGSDLMRALFRENPHAVGQGIAAADGKSAAEGRFEAGACRNRLQALHEIAGGEIAQLEEEAADNGAQVEGLLRERSLLLERLRQVDATIETKQEAHDNALRRAISRRAAYERDRAQELEQLQYWENTLSCVGECERVLELLSSVRQDLANQLACAASCAVSDARSPPSLPEDASGSDGDNTLYVYLNSIQVCLQMEVECIRRLRIRARRDEAELSDAMSEIAAYEGLGMPTLGAKLRGKVHQLQANIAEDRLAEEVILNQAREQERKWEQTFSTLSSATANGHASSCVEDGAPDACLTHQKHGNAGSAAEIEGKVAGPTLTRLRDLFAVLETIGHDGDDEDSDVISTEATTRTDAACEDPLGAGGGASDYMADGGGRGREAIVTRDARLVANAPVHQCVPSERASGSSSTSPGAMAPSASPSMVRKADRSYHRAQQGQIAPHSSESVLRSSASPSSCQVRNSSVNARDVHDTSNDYASLCSSRRAHGPAPSRIRGGIRLPSPTQDDGRSLGGHLKWLSDVEGDKMRSGIEGKAPIALPQSTRADAAVVKLQSRPRPGGRPHTKNVSARHASRNQPNAHALRSSSSDSVHVGVRDANDSDAHESHVENVTKEKIPPASKKERGGAIDVEASPADTGSEEPMSHVTTRTGAGTAPSSRCSSPSSSISGERSSPANVKAARTSKLRRANKKTKAMTGGKKVYSKASRSKAAKPPPHSGSDERGVGSADQDRGQADKKRMDKAAAVTKGAKTRDKTNTHDGDADESGPVTAATKHMSSRSSSPNGKRWEEEKERGDSAPAYTTPPDGQDRTTKDIDTKTRVKISHNGDDKTRHQGDRRAKDADTVARNVRGGKSKRSVQPRVRADSASRGIGDTGGAAGGRSSNPASKHPPAAAPWTRPASSGGLPSPASSPASSGGGPAPTSSNVTDADVCDGPDVNEGKHRPCEPYNDEPAKMQKGPLTGRKHSKVKQKQEKAKAGGSRKQVKEVTDLDAASIPAACY